MDYIPLVENIYSWRSVNSRPIVVEVLSREIYVFDLCLTSNGSMSLFSNNRNYDMNGMPHNTSCFPAQNIKFEM